jgi:hypothetical protein
LGFSAFLVHKPSLSRQEVPSSACVSGGLKKRLEKTLTRGDGTLDSPPLLSNRRILRAFAEYLFVHMTIYPYIYLSIYLFSYTPIYRDTYRP